MARWNPWQQGRGDDEKPSAHRLGGPGANVGSTVLFTVLLLSPFLWGAHYTRWLVGLAIGVILGLYFYLRRERYGEPGPDADETRFPP
jgi:hypothetical protein